MEHRPEPLLLFVLAAALAVAPTSAQDLGRLTPPVSPILKPPPPRGTSRPTPRPGMAVTPDRPHTIWAAIRFTVREYPLIPFERLRQLGVGTIHPHFGRLRVLPDGRVELYDFYGKVLWPDQKTEMKQMVQRLHAEGFRVVPWLSVKRAKPEGSFWIYDDWAPVVRTVRTLVDQMGLDGFQLDPEPLNVADVAALNTGLGWLARVMRGRELSVAVPKLIAGTPDHETGYQWADLKPFEALTNADALYLMTYDTRCQDARSYTALLRGNVAVARALKGRTRVYMGMPSYPMERPKKTDPPKKGQKAPKPAPVHRAAHVMPPEEGRTFARALRNHPDLSALAGIAIYDLEEPEDTQWLAAWMMAEEGLDSLNARMRAAVLPDEQITAVARAVAAAVTAAAAQLRG